MITYKAQPSLKRSHRILFQENTQISLIHPRGDERKSQSITTFMDVEVSPESKQRDYVLMLHSTPNPRLP